MLVPVTAALGSYLLPIPVFGISIFAYRLLVLLLFPLSLLLTRKITWWSNPVARSYVLLGCFWVLWGGMSYFWAPDPSAAIKDVLAVGFGFGGGLLLLFLKSHSADGVDALRQGWLLAYIVAGIIAVWEVLTGNHLPSAYVQTTPDYALRNITISTFGNPNNYGAFLLLSSPFLLWSFLVSKGRIRRAIRLGILATLPVFVVLSASRVAFIGLGAQLAVYGLLRVRRWRLLLGFFGIVVVLSLFVERFLQSETILAQKLALSLGDDLRPGGSIARRLNLLLDGLWFVYISGGLGVGAGGFQYMVQRGSASFATTSFLSPHNFWIEVLSQYGILVFFVLVVWIIYLFGIAVQARRTLRYCATSRIIAEMMLIALAGYMFASVTSSSYVVQPTTWMFLGSLVVVGTFLWNKRVLEKRGAC